MVVYNTRENDTARSLNDMMTAKAKIVLSSAQVMSVMDIAYNVQMPDHFQNLTGMIDVTVDGSVLVGLLICSSADRSASTST